MKQFGGSLQVTYGLQCGVQGKSQADVSSSRSEFDELREMLKQQQEQLSQLTQGLSQLQGSRLRNHSRHGPVICRRCQRSGHFTRDCDGERVPSPVICRRCQRAGHFARDCNREHVPSRPWTMKLAATTCSRHFAATTVLFEPLEVGLPAGLFAVSALICVSNGTAYVPVVNVQ